MKSIYVTDISNGMTITNETFAVNEAKQVTTKDGKPYYKLVLADKTGIINANIWSDRFDQIEKSALKVGNVVMIDATASEFKGSVNLSIMKLTHVDESQLDEFIEGSDLNLEDMWKSLELHIASIESSEIKQFLEKLFADDEIKRRFKIWPAAEMVHHSFRGGLIEHVLEMLDMSETLRKSYKEADFDLVKAGIIIHDIGKIREMEIVGTVVQKTTEGQLLGHLVISYEILIEYGTDVLSAENIMKLKHIILSHHGQREYGSPVVPATIEAAIVSKVDDASYFVRTFQKAIRKGAETEDGFTEWDRFLQTRVYKG